ncbi:MAG: GNAT family N-acetyltransferase [Kofleriaceae bacterium]
MDSATDTEIEALLREVYVGGGFTSHEDAGRFAGAAVRARGQVLVERAKDGRLAGMIVVVPPRSTERRIATDEEAELQLLAVRGDQRRAGLGQRLVVAALEVVVASGAKRCVLWTQPTMHAAQRLYERCHFVREAARDFERGGRRLVYVHALARAG